MNDQPEISQMSQLLSVFYRTTLNKGKSETLLQNEIKNVTSYIDIQRLLHDNCFDVLYQIDPNLPEIEVPNLLHHGQWSWDPTRKTCHSSYNRLVWLRT